MCQITSKRYGDNLAIAIDNASFVTGSLWLTGYARPDKLFTANRDLMVRQLCALKASSFDRIIEGVIDIWRSGNTL